MNCLEFSISYLIISYRIEMVTTVHCYFFPSQQNPVAIATFNSGGVTGTIRFTQDSNNTVITGTLHSLPAQRDVIIYSFPVYTTLNPVERCSGLFVGPSFFNPLISSRLCSVSEPNECVIEDLNIR